ncbi:MAG: chemotaxis protein CheX [Treponema sp.]|jgi:chemotaxis protein CheX|nr:chemotaxis protein CheX [Treponema sp.]
MEKYIQPFIKVCQAVFRDFCQTEVTPGRVFFVEREEFRKDWDISGIIGLSGEVKGAVVISLKTASATKIAGILTGTVHKHLDADVADAVGEIVNIISGNVKKDLENTFRIIISLPTIVKGAVHSAIWPSEKPRIICIPFSLFKDHEMCLSVAIDLNK